MKTLLKLIKYFLILLTVLFVGYLAVYFSNEELASVLNEEYDFYIYLQLIHVFLSLSVLFILWSNNLFSTSSKIDQTLLVFFFSVIGLWIWFVVYYKKYVKYENEKEANN